MVKITKSKFTDEELQKIQEQVRKESRPYDYRTKTYPFEVIVRKLGLEDDDGTSIYIPQYLKKGFRWTQNKQSNFIESVLLGIPITPFIFLENENKKWAVIDGMQRISTLVSFYNNEFALQNLSSLT